MDKAALELAEEVMEELDRALSPLGVELIKVGLEESGGYPTVLIGAPGTDGEAVVCSVLPGSLGKMNVVFIQLYRNLTPPVSEERREELERFIWGANQRFMLGTLLMQQDRLDMRYVLALDPVTAMDEEHMQTCVAAFFHQAAVYAGLGREIIDGRKTARQALEHRE